MLERISQKRKMYILIPSHVPDGFAPCASAHASLIAHLKWEEDVDYNNWLDHSFKKVVCRVSPKSLKRALRSGIPYEVVNEDTMDNMAVAYVFYPEAEFPNFFAKMSLWKPVALYVSGDKISDELHDKITDFLADTRKGVCDPDYDSNIKEIKQALEDE